MQQGLFPPLFIQPFLYHPNSRGLFGLSRNSCIIFIYDDFLILIF